jgi:hypothetical protein
MSTSLPTAAAQLTLLLSSSVYADEPDSDAVLNCQRAHVAAAEAINQGKRGGAASIRID